MSSASESNVKRTKVQIMLDEFAATPRYKRYSVLRDSPMHEQAVSIVHAAQELRGLIGKFLQDFEPGYWHCIAKGGWARIALR